MEPFTKKIAVFAGSECDGPKKEYYLALARRTGALLAQSGFVAMTGAGSAGLMNETLRGAHESGGKTMGIGLNIKGRTQSTFAHSIDIYDKLGLRQDQLIQLGDAYIALPGGIGTLYEIANIIALKRIDEMPTDKPLILIDEYYDMIRPLIRTMMAEGFARDLDACYTIVKTPEEAIYLLKKYFL